MKLLLMVLCISVVVIPSFAKKKVKYRKTQDVNFNETSIDGVARTPDGAYVNPKRGMDFLPLYKVKKDFDEEILSSVEYLR